LQLKVLELSASRNINDDGAEMLLECLSNIDELRLTDDNISDGMACKLKLRGREVGCIVTV